jgi:hypothetical protein
MKSKNLTMKTDKYPGKGSKSGRNGVKRSFGTCIGSTGNW